MALLLMLNQTLMMTSSNIVSSLPEEPKVALLDADILVYRVGFASEDEEEKIAVARVTEFVTDTVYFDLDCEDYEAWITGPDNFRFDVAVTAPYKGNRKAPKPKHYDAIRLHLQAMGAELTLGYEADDAICIRATELKDKCWIVSLDKDLDQIQGWHYNFVRREKYYITEAEGLKRFYKQILIGDRVDNIIGLRGIGPVKADKILADKHTALEMYNECVEQYKGDTARVLENARLLHLLRYQGEVWQPPAKE
jgi:5'-3' exonuclease, N-terminal resolvase-like domain